jgi:uncharacterized membrane protein YbhN (UPF0104 family)
MTRALWAWARVIGGLAIVGLLVWRLGTAAFLDGLRVIDGPTVLVAVGIGLLTTVFSAWRWSLVAGGLGVRLPLRAAVADYYRALFLNAALPGGVLGDVHRAVRHGKDSGDVGRGVRAVVLERSAGQLVVVGVAVPMLLAGPLVPGVRWGTFGPAAAVGAAALAVFVLLALLVFLRRHGSSWFDRAFRATASDLRRGLLARGNWAGILLSSALVLAGHLATFLLAARVAGSSAPVGTLLPLMMLALLAMALPLNVGGWGPREGVAAWAFGAAGLGAAQGLTTAVVYGLFAFVASLPGAAVLITRWIARLRADRAGPVLAGRVEAVGPGEAVGHRIAQQHDVAELAHLGQDRPVLRTPREVAVADEARRPRVAHEERRDRQVQFVDQAGGQKLGVHGAAALDHQPAHPADMQVRQHPVQVDGIAPVNDGRHPAQPVVGLVERRRRAVDELVAVPSGEELR